MSKQTKILLLRSEQLEGKDSFTQTLHEHHHSVQDISVMSFHYPHQHHLHTHLTHPHLYHALIFTSPRAVHALSLLPDSRDLLQQWRHKVAYVVGEATHSAARDLGLKTRGKECGNSCKLAELILQDLPPHSPPATLLFLCSSKRMDVIPSKCKERGVCVECLEVYEACKSQQLHQQLQHCLAMDPPDYVLFFSASAVTFSSQAFIHSSFNPSLKLLAMGRCTAEAIEKEGLRVYATLNSPDVHSLLSVVVEE